MKLRTMQCTYCYGTGKDRDLFECKHCNGVGSIAITDTGPDPLVDPMFEVVIPFGIIGYFVWYLADLINVSDIVMYIMFAITTVCVIKVRKYAGWIAYFCFGFYIIESLYSKGLIFN